MKFCDFKLLDLPLQAHIVYRYGIYLSDRAEDDLYIALYKLSDFYVEVYYRYSNGEIVKFISFHSDVLLEPYLKKIPIGKLFDQQPVSC